MKKIAIISGHRGRGTGAIGKTIDEGAETIWLRNKIEYFLCTKYNIVPIVDCDTDSLNSVVRELRTELNKEDVCIDIHFDSFNDSSANGTTVFIPKNPTKDETEAADSLLKLVTSTIGTRSRGVKLESAGQHNSLAMLSGFDCCNLLLEVAFISSSFDSAKYLLKRELLAESIADWLHSEIL